MNTRSGWGLSAGENKLWEVGRTSQIIDMASRCTYEIFQFSNVELSYFRELRFQQMSTL